MEQRRQHRDPVADSFRPGQQRRRPDEHLQQPGAVFLAQAPRMPVPGEPAHVGGQHRVQRAHPAITPAHRLARRRGHLERLGVLRRDPVISADVDHHAALVCQPDEEIRGMPARLAARLPQQPEGLSGKRPHPRREVEHYQLVAFQPRLESDVPAHASGEVQTREVPLTLIGGKAPHRRHILKPGIPAHCQRALALDEAGAARLQEPQL